MKYLISISIFISLLLSVAQIKGQTLALSDLDTLPLLSLEEAKKLPPSEVYRLSLKKEKLTELPKEIFLFENLQELNLTKNKIYYFPKNLDQFKYLQILNFSNNRLATIPKEIGNLTNLKKLILNQNSFAYLPEEIGALKKLELLDLWGNEISHLPDEIVELRSTLKELDMRVILMSNQEHQNIKALLPETKIHFSKSCNCGF